MSGTATVGVVRATTFRTVLFVMALCCFVGTFAASADRWDFAFNSAVGSIESLRADEKPDNDWVNYEGRQRSIFQVNLTDAQGARRTIGLFLAREDVSKLLAGQSLAITYLKDNPKRFIVKGEPLPSWGLGWLILGLLILAVFIVSLKLR